MPRRSPGSAVALGFRVKTGRAIAVALQGPASRPSILFRREVQLWDPKVPESHQPYHGAIMPFVPASPKAIERGRKAAARAAAQVVQTLCEELHAAGHCLAGVTLVVVSNPDISRIGSAHVRAHALEGILFREILEEAARACRLPATVVLEREALARTAAALKRTPAQLQSTLADFRARIGSPWRAEEKSAALGALLAFRW